MLVSLALVADRIPDLAQKAGVDVITRACDFVGSDVEIADVTMDLVMLFEPDERTLETIEQIKDVPPVDLGDVHRDGHE